MQIIPRILLLLTLSVMCSGAYCGVAEDCKSEVDAMRKFISSGLNVADRAVVEKIEVKVLNTIPLSQVGAYGRVDGSPVIALNVGSCIKFSELANAIAFTSLVVKDERYLFGYIRYLAYADLFGVNFVTPQEYADYVGVKDFKDRIAATKGVHELQDVMRVGILAFVVAHEMAHHVLGHLRGDGFTLADKRAQETAADKWAAERLLKIGLNPSMAVFSLLLMNESQQRSSSGEVMSDHPASIKRAANLTGFVVDYVVGNPDVIKATLKEINAPYTYDALLSAVKSLDFMVRGRLSQQNIYDHMNGGSIIALAKGGDIFWQLRLGELYGSGAVDGISYDLKEMVHWYEIAAANSQRFSYFDEADANYRAGWVLGLQGVVPFDYKAACKYMKRSADMGYVLGVEAYKLLVSKSGCRFD